MYGLDVFVVSAMEEKQSYTVCVKTTQEASCSLVATNKRPEGKHTCRQLVTQLRSG